MTRTLLVATIGVIGCCTHWCGPAHAETTTERALAALCGPRAVYLAPHVDAAADGLWMYTEWIVALMYAENHRCDPNRVNRRTGAVGLMQILPRGNANPKRLTVARLKDPATNVRLGTQHLRRLFLLCLDFGGAVSLYHGNGKAYHGRGRCSVDGHARKVLRNVERVRRAWREMRQREGRS